MSIKHIRKIPTGSPHVEARNTGWGIKIVRFLTNNSLYVANDTRQCHSYYAMLIGTHMRSLRWCHFQWPSVTPNLDFQGHGCPRPIVCAADARDLFAIAKFLVNIVWINEWKSSRQVVSGSFVCVCKKKPPCAGRGSCRIGSICFLAGWPQPDSSFIICLVLLMLVVFVSYCLGFCIVTWL